MDLFGLLYDSTLGRTEEHLGRDVDLAPFEIRSQCVGGFAQDLVGVFTGRLFELSRVGKVTAVYIDSHWHRHVDNGHDRNRVLAAESKVFQHLDGRRTSLGSVGCEQNFHELVLRLSVLSNILHQKLDPISGGKAQISTCSNNRVSNCFSTRISVSVRLMVVLSSRPAHSASSRASASAPFDVRKIRVERASSSYLDRVTKSPSSNPPKILLTVGG